MELLTAIRDVVPQKKDDALCDGEGPPLAGPTEADAPAGQL